MPDGCDSLDPSQRLRILLVPQGGCVAHVARPLAIARGLKALGHDVCFACSGPYARLVQDAGFAARSILAEPSQLALRLSQGQPPSQVDMQQIELCVEAEMALIAELRPDAVVGDFRPTLSISCELSRRPYIAVASACWTRYSALAPRAPWGHILGRLCGQRAADWAFSRLRARMLRRCIAPFNDFCHRRGLPPRQSILDLLESRFLNLLTDVPQLFPLTRQPSHYCYIGPALWEPYPTPPEWFGRLRNDLPTICVNMPAAGLVEMLHAALDTLGHSNTQLVMTTGGPDPPASLPPNCFVDRFALTSRIVERSDVVISHGDSHTVYQALAAGVPVLGIPTTLEQEVNVRRAEELGVGLTLPVRRLTAARLGEAANELLTRPSYRTRAAELARSIKSYDAATLGAKAIIKRLNQVRNADCGVRSDEELPVA